MPSEPLTFAGICESIAYSRRNGVPLRSIKMSYDQLVHLISHSTFYDRLNFVITINHDGTCTETIYGLPIEIVQSTGQMGIPFSGQQKLLPAPHRTPQEKYMDELREWKRLRDLEEDKDD